MFHFFAYLFKLKEISRWNLRRNTRTENVMEHSCEVAMIAHTLVTLQNVRYGGQLGADCAATLAVFHETSETITGDIVTPIKYNNAALTEQFKRLETLAAARMCEQLPDDLKAAYNPLIMDPTDYPEWPYVKAADKIAAYIKCIEELKGGNGEFAAAKEQIYAAIMAIKIAAVQDFMLEFMPSFSLTLDELM